MNPGKPAELAWTRKINSEGKDPLEFTLSVMEKLHLVFLHFLVYYDDLTI